MKNARHAPGKEIEGKYFDSEFQGSVFLAFIP